MAKTHFKPQDTAGPGAEHRPRFHVLDAAITLPRVIHWFRSTVILPSFSTDTRQHLRIPPLLDDITDTAIGRAPLNPSARATMKS